MQQTVYSHDVSISTYSTTSLILAFCSADAAAHASVLSPFNKTLKRDTSGSKFASMSFKSCSAALIRLVQSGSGQFSPATTGCRRLADYAFLPRTCGCEHKALDVRNPSGHAASLPRVPIWRVVMTFCNLRHLGGKPSTLQTWVRITIR